MSQHNLTYLPSGLEGRQVPPETAYTGKSFNVVRPLAWTALALIITLSIVLSTYIGNMARSAFITKQKDFAALLADNLNHQIYRRFTLPTLLGFGQIDLRQNAQYERLDQVIQSTIHGLHVGDLRIYGHNGNISYSVSRDELGKEDLTSEQIMAAAMGTEPIFVLLSEIPYWKAFFTYPLASNTFTLQTIYPLRIENRLNSSTEYGPIMGVLEFTQDITKDMGNTLRFQQLLIVVILVSSSLLFALLLFFIQRTNKIMAERRKQEQHLLEELHQNEKLASMGRVVASIAHEIRNPLGVIQSSTELLLKKNAGADPMTSKLLQATYDETKRLSQTVNDFLDYAKPRQPRHGTVEICSVIAKAILFLEPDLAARQVTVLPSYDSDFRAYTLGDSDLLYRVFYNIMGNAMQAMETNGTIRVSINDAPSTGRMQIVFKDTGPGFPSDLLTKVLDPFFTTKDNGTGLGLPIVKSILLSHEGTLELDNAAEGGASVTVTLPSQLVQ